MSGTSASAAQALQSPGWEAAGGLSVLPGAPLGCVCTEDWEPGDWELDSRG